MATETVDEDIYIREEEDRIDLDDVPPKPWVVFKEGHLCCYLCQTFKVVREPIELETFRAALLRFSDQHVDCYKLSKVVYDNTPRRKMNISSEDLEAAVLTAASTYIELLKSHGRRSESLKMFHPQFGKFVVSIQLDGASKPLSSSDPDRVKFISDIRKLRTALKITTNLLDQHDRTYGQGDENGCEDLSSEHQRQTWVKLAGGPEWWLNSMKRPHVRTKSKARRR